MFPPSDSHSLENSSDTSSSGAHGTSGASNGGASNGTSTVDDRRGHDLVPFSGGLTAPGGMPWSYGPMRPEILTATPTFSNLMHALRRRLWLGIFGGIVLGGLLGYAAWRLMPTKYESAALVQVKIQNPVIWEQTSGAVDFETYKHNLMQLIKAPFVINKALDDRTVHDLPLIKEHGLDAAAWLHDALIVNTDQGGERVRLSLLNDDPQGLPEIVNSVIDAYQHEIVDKERTDKLKQRDKLDKTVRDYQKQVMDKERTLFDLTQSIGTEDADTAEAKYRLESADLESLMQSRHDAQRSMDELDMTIELAKLKADRAKEGQVSDAQIDEAIAHDPQIMQATNDMNMLHREEREIKKVTRRSSDPSIVRIHESIAAVEQSMEEMRNADRQKLIETIKRDADLGGSNMKALKLQRDLYAKRFADTTTQIGVKRKAVQQLKQFNGEAAALRTEIAELQRVVNDMGHTLTQWNIELGAESRVAFPEKAAAARAVDPYKQYGMAGFGGLLGFGLALFGATFYEFFSRRLNSATDVAEGLGIRVMGDLPALRRRRIALRARSRKAVHGIVAESINSIRAALVRNAEPGACNVYLVTSAAEQEGKTTVASQLAASLARSGKRTLLVDCDLRHPGAHLVFGLANEYGFSEMLRGEVLVDDAIRPTPADHLWMITAGRCCAQAVLMLGKEALGDVFAQLESRFDFIVVDAGPVLKVADPLLLGQYVDGAILSVLRDVSQIHKVYEASERLKLAGVKVVGAVINGIDDHGAFDRYNVELPAA